MDGLPPDEDGAAKCAGISKITSGYLSPMKLSFYSPPSINLGGCSSQRRQIPGRQARICAGDTREAYYCGRNGRRARRGPAARRCSTRLGSIKSAKRAGEQTQLAEAVAREVRERLDPLIIKRSPLSVPVKKPKATWVQPVVQAEIEYGGITDDGLLREAVFKGLRDDLPAAEAPTAPTRAHRSGEGRGGVPRENILQLLPDAVAPSKEELAAYWRKVAKRALPYLGRRPLKLVRH